MAEQGDNRKKSLTKGSAGVLGTDIDAQVSTSSPGTAQKELAPSQDKPWSLPFSLHDFRKKQLEDPDINPVFKWLESGIRLVGCEVVAFSPAT